MWAIVTLKVLAAGSTLTLPFAIGPDVLFANQAECTSAALIYAPVAAKAHVALGCKFYPVVSKKAEAF